MSTEDIDLTSDLIRRGVKHMGSKKFFVALHNAFIHGEVFEEAGEHLEDEELGKLFDHFDGILDILKSVE